MAAFRFALQASGAASPAAWRELSRKAEDLGYATLYVPDHLDDQWSPMLALLLAAEATTTLASGRSSWTTISAIPSCWPRRPPPST